MTSRTNSPGSPPRRPSGAGLLTNPDKGRVLVVDGDPDVVRMLEVKLAREGHEVFVAESGRAALTMVGTGNLDLALIDRGLLDMPALELLAKLREPRAHFEAIVMTVDPTPDAMLEALDHGAFDLVVKPFSNLRLVTAKIRSAVAKVHAERDRDELARLLHAQTQDIVEREAKAEQRATPSSDLLPELAAEVPGDLDLAGMSGVDALTGLPNRSAAELRFKTETQRALRYDRPMCIALASVDSLELVVDRHGSQVADGVLRGVANIFTGMVRDVDFVARTQGGEFFFLFPETPKDNGVIVVERIRQALAQSSFREFVEGSENEFRLTASFGIAGLPTDTLNADILKRSAESALSEARIAGDCVVAFRSGSLRLH